MPLNQNFVPDKVILLIKAQYYDPGIVRVQYHTLATTQYDRISYSYLNISKYPKPDKFQNRKKPILYYGKHLTC